MLRLKKSLKMNNEDTKSNVPAPQAKQLENICTDDSYKCTRLPAFISTTNVRELFGLREGESMEEAFTRLEANDPAAKADLQNRLITEQNSIEASTQMIELIKQKNVADLDKAREAANKEFLCKEFNNTEGECQ